MRKLLLSLAVMLGVLSPLFYVQPVLAVDVLKPVCEQSVHNTEVPQVCKDNKANSTENPITGVLKVAIDVLSLIAGVMAVVMIVLSGLRFVVGAGDSASIAGARRNLIFAIIGLVIVFIAQFIIPFILSRVL